jgi:LuxR family maltose regulon positive regulatory protein
LFVVQCLSRWQEFLVLADHYEQVFLKMSEKDDFRHLNLSAMYFLLGTMRFQMSIIDNNYNFYEYYAKAAEHLLKTTNPLGNTINFAHGAWYGLMSSNKKGALQEYIETSISATQLINTHLDNVFAGGEDLVQGELLFYQGEISQAEPYILRGLENAQQYRRYEIIHRASFYIMRIAVLQGNRKKAEQALNDIMSLLQEKEYSLRFITYDIAFGWYQYILRQPETVPAWLKEKFAPYGIASQIENYGNQMKARYHYMTKNYQPLLTYIEQMKQRESILYGRVEMLAMEACVYYHMKNKKAAFAAFKTAYETASPNDIIMPFLELGKDMRTLVAAYTRENLNDVPENWLEKVKRKSSSYSKNQSFFISDYKKVNALDGASALSSRENDVLYALYRGISRMEIADSLNLSINSVNTIINSIYRKLNANNIADAVRIAVERKLV